MSFGSNALLVCLNSTNTACSATSRGGLAPTSSEGGLFFLTGNQTCMNVAAGFDTGFSLNYVGNFNGSVGVYDGLNGTGNLLTTVKLDTQPGQLPGLQRWVLPVRRSGCELCRHRQVRVLWRRGQPDRV